MNGWHGIHKGFGSARSNAKRQQNRHRFLRWRRRERERERWLSLSLFEKMKELWRRFIKPCANTN